MSLVETSLSIAEAAKRYRVCSLTIERWIMAGRLPGVFRVSRDRYFLREDLEAFDRHLVQRAAHEAGGGDPDDVPTPNYSVPPRKAIRLPDEPKA